MMFTVFKVVAIFCGLFALARGQSTDVHRCLISKGILPLNAHVHGCTTPPCLLPQLQDVVIDVIFEAPRTISNMTTLATAILNFIIEVDFPYDLQANSVTCNFFTNTFCPVLQGEIVQYRLNMFIESVFPVNTVATVEFKVRDNEAGEDIWCVRVPIRILPPQPAAASDSLPALLTAE
ncbi:uncharacterized protein LOC112056159 [Bicyclus anynana]|uniref:Uncharacterized protein LOC112056159 n=1 Tax=Bicyclus anynana TaxID=110368 RepID=A0ABM3LIH6_BICAN|nr:uncharacterized protein LOC112056159 [Bicyclus anynana]